MIKKLLEALKKITVEKTLLALAAGFAAYNFGLAGGYMEHGEGGYFSPGGLIAGVVVNVTLAIAASRIGSLKGAARTRQASAAFYGMLLISPLLVAPVIFYSLPDTFLGVWWLRALWAVCWAGVADIAIVLAGAVTGRGLISLAEDKPQSGAQSGAGADGGAASAGAVRKGVRRSADAVREECGALSAQYACTAAECGWSPSVDALEESARAGKSARSAAASAKAGHMKNKHPKPIAIDQSLLLPAKKDGER